VAVYIIIWFLLVYVCVCVCVCVCGIGQHQTLITTSDTRPATCHLTTDINGLIFSTQWILEEFKVKFLYLQHVCVMHSRILNRQIAKPS